MSPGVAVVTDTPSGASSRASVREKTLVAALPDAYALSQGIGWPCPTIEPMLIESVPGDRRLCVLDDVHASLDVLRGSRADEHGREGCTISKGVARRDEPCTTRMGPVRLAQAAWGVRTEDVGSKALLGR